MERNHPSMGRGNSMSNIAVQGGATGTGTVTLLAPSTSTSRVLTLPDSTGTIAAASSGTADATTFLRGDGAWATVGGVSTGDIVYTSQPLTSPSYLPANGLVYSQASYPALYALVGTLYPIGAMSPDRSTGGTYAKDAAFGAGVYVLVMEAGALSTSTDTITWTARTSSFSTTSINGATFGSSLFVVVGNTGKLATSSDGTTWTQRTSTFGTSNLYSVAFGAGVFVAVGADGKLATSTDGTTWTARTSSFSTSAIYKVIFGNGVFVAGGVDGKIATSSDGITWTQRTLPGVTASNQFSIMAFGVGTYVAYSGSSGWISYDGITWVLASISTFTPNSIGFIGKTFVTFAEGNASSVYDICTSVDGFNWVITAKDALGGIPTLTFANGNVLLFGNYYNSLKTTTYTYDTTTQFKVPNAQANNIAPFAYVKT